MPILYVWDAPLWLTLENNTTYDVSAVEQVICDWVHNGIQYAYEHCEVRPYLDVEITSSVINKSMKTNIPTTTSVALYE